MFNIEIIPATLIFFAGLLVGVMGILIFNKFRTGNISPNAIKKEKDEYQDKVEAHFDETAKKFKDMTTQYQELYQHLSVGATNLCRPEKITAGLIDQANPLKAVSPIEAVSSNEAVSPNKVKSKNSKSETSAKKSGKTASKDKSAS